MEFSLIFSRHASQPFDLLDSFDDLLAGYALL